MTPLWRIWLASTMLTTTTLGHVTPSPTVGELRHFVLRHPTGVALTTSWYGPRFHTHLTASGEPFDERWLTCAHRTLPFGTRLRLFNPSNGRSVVVRVNDRGPFVAGRTLDISTMAAFRLGMLTHGIATLQMEVMHEQIN